MLSMNEPNELDAPIQYYHRERKTLETEQVYGEAFLRWVYANPLGRLSLALVVKRIAFSCWYGWRMDRSRSQQKIAPFIQQYGLNAEEFADPVSAYKTFNQFFYRRLKASARPVESGSDLAVFPADGRHLIIENVSNCDQFYIKGQRFDLGEFLADPELAARFEGGSLIISRLCPVDYHRYHFPVSGRCAAPQTINGFLYSVSPLALRRSLAILWQNRRALTLIDSPQFGSVVMMEIGATCVGGMHTTYQPGSVTKGDEKGYFSFGGSCVATLFAAGRLQIDPDLLQQGAQGREVYAPMGTRIGIVANNGED